MFQKYLLHKTSQKGKMKTKNNSYLKVFALYYGIDTLQLLYIKDTDYCIFIEI